MFKSVVWSSTIDYPDEVSTVLFVGTCNWNCEYCYNRNLVNNPSIDFKKVILPKLLQRQKFIDHVIISGGECTCYSELENIIDILNQNGFIVGIHTNGSNPKILSKIINKIEFVGIDIKTSFDRYKEIDKLIDIKKIKKSILIILKSNKKYEFRTTLYPNYVCLNDCIEVAKYLKKNKCNQYVLQQYENSFDSNSTKPYPIDFVKEIKDNCNEILPTVLKGW